MTFTLLHGDMLGHLAEMPADSLGACVTDPPYGLEFMSVAWDTFNDGRKGGERVPNTWGDHGSKEHPRNAYQTAHIAAKKNRAFGEFSAAWAAEVLRVLKPGGYLLAFGGTRTYHRLACAIEDSGFQVRDCLMWLYSQGFPKGKNLGCTCKRVGTTIPYDHMVRAEAPETPSEHDVRPVSEADLSAAIDADDQRGEVLLTSVSECGSPIEGAATPGTAPLRSGQPRLEGWGDVQALEGQLHRPEVRQVPPGSPADGAQGRLHHGAPSRDGAEDRPSPSADGSGSPHRPQHAEQRPGESGVVRQQRRAQTGRGRTCEGCGGLVDFQGWNTALKPAWEPIILARKPVSEASVAANIARWGTGGLNIDGCRLRVAADDPNRRQATGENGGAGSLFGVGNHARPATLSDGRWPANVVLDEETAALLDEQSGERKSGGNIAIDNNRHVYGKYGPRTFNVYADTGGASRFFYCAKASPSERGTFNDHPTVKPLALMQWLVRLVTPAGETILDPFCGSGSTLLAANREGFNCIGIDRDDHAIEIARRRIENEVPITVDGQTTYRGVPVDRQVSLFE